MKKKLCITYITTGKYKIFFKPFIQSYYEKFCIDEDRVFYIFADDKDYIEKEIKNLGLDLKYEIFTISGVNDADYIKFRKFKILNSAEEKYFQFDYIFYFNGNLVCNLPVTISELFPEDKEQFAVVHSLFNKVKNPMLTSLCKLPKSAAYFDHNSFKDTYKYFQSGCIGCTYNRWIKLINFIESCRYFDEYYDYTKYIPWHDETYYNRYINVLIRQVPKKINILDGKLYLCSWLNIMKPYRDICKMILINKENVWRSNNE